MIDTILELLSYIDAPEMKKFILILLLYLLAVIGAGKLFHSYLVIKYIRNSFIAVLGAVIVITADILFIEPSTGKYWAFLWGAGAVCLLSASILFIRYKHYCHILKVMKKTESEDIISAWKKLNEIPLSNLTPGIKKKYLERCLFVLLLLGDLEKAERYLSQLGVTDGPLFYFFHGFKQMSAGDIVRAGESMMKAEKCCQQNTPPQLYIQILNNRGVLYVCQGNYQEADYYFKQAIAAAGQNKKMNMEILEPVYYNYCFNLCRIREDMKRGDWKKILEEYRDLLDMGKAKAFISVCNIELELLRQTEENTQETEIWIQEQFLQTLKYGLTEQERCVYEGSMARIVCSMRFNPTNCLEALEKDREKLSGLPMPARYRTWKEIDLLFRDLYDDRLLGQYHDLDRAAENYMAFQAEKEIQNYIDSLPAEAVYERCHYRKELAGMKRMHIEEYRFEKVKQMLEDITAVYEENHLEIDALDTRMAILDEGTFALNLTEHHKPIYAAEMQNQMQLVEAKLEKMIQHPKTAEYALRLCFYCCHLDEYQKCLMYFKRFEEAGLSLSHFAPWLRNYYSFCSVVIRILKFADAIEQVRRERSKLEIYEEAVQNWFEQFPFSDGFHASLLLGRFMGCKTIRVKYKIWYQDNEIDREGRRDFLDSKNEDRLKAHVWYCEESIHMEADLTYRQFSSDEKSDFILFSETHHPFEVNESCHLLKQARMSRMNFLGIQEKYIEIKNLPKDVQELLDIVYNIIMSKITD